MWQTRRIYSEAEALGWVASWSPVLGTALAARAAWAFGKQVRIPGATSMSGVPADNRKPRTVDSLQFFGCSLGGTAVALSDPPARSGPAGSRRVCRQPPCQRRHAGAVCDAIDGGSPFAPTRPQGSTARQVPKTFPRHRGRSMTRARLAAQLD